MNTIESNKLIAGKSADRVHKGYRFGTADWQAETKPSFIERY